MINNKFKQQGSVSMFIVVFSALLITIVSIGFTGIMVQNQQQASNVDLSQSAYDSAQAGVEDAKRALLRYQSICSVAGNATECANAKASMSLSTCNTALTSLTGVSVAGGEVKVQTNGGTNALDQAYTCVKIKLDTDDYLGSLIANDSKLIPLSGVSGFNKVRLQWFSPSDISSGSFAVNLQNAGSTPLLPQASWPINRPSIMQVQLIQYGDNFTLNDLESSLNNDTLFLYPIVGGSASLISTLSFSLDAHKNPTGTPPSSAPQPVACLANLSGGGYACNIDLLLPNQTGGGNRNAYLRVRSLYNKSSFRLSLIDSAGALVRFNGVQTEIDSTGRANDLFRRVQSRVELTDMNFPYPEAAVDTNGSFCKDFSITDLASDYSGSTTCTP